MAQLSLISKVLYKPWAHVFIHVTSNLILFVTENTLHSSKLYNMYFFVKGECALTEGPTATHLKVCRIRSDPGPVMDHQVPVFIKELPEKQWDLTTQQVSNISVKS